MKIPKGNEFCQRCGKIYELVYSVPDEIWAEITPSDDKEAGLLCIECADRIAREKEIFLFFKAEELK